MSANAAWASQPQWCVLDTDFGLGLQFLTTWAAWRTDAQRPTLLHFIAFQAHPVEPVHPVEELQGLAQELRAELQAQYWGLLPGIHRLAFDGGRVLLTLCMGDAQTLMRSQDWAVDSVYLRGDASLYMLKAVARCCRRGARLALDSVADADTVQVRHDLAQCGFTVADSGVGFLGVLLEATFAPHWEPHTPRSSGPVAPSHCIVIGGGLAGAGVASSLARRGWKVLVLDKAATPAAGASGLPVGLCFPHISPDDSPLSRLSRSGVRWTFQHAEALLQTGTDWKMSGVLEHRIDGSSGLAADWHTGPGTDWSHTAPPETLRAAHLPTDAVGCWHARAGWVRPAHLVAALLAQQGITWQGHSDVARLDYKDDEGTPLWQALDSEGAVLASAPWVVVAAGPASRGLTGERLRFQLLRGQLSWGVQDPAMAPFLPPFPVNGEGSLIPHIPLNDGSSAWHLGSTFERNISTLPLSLGDRHAGHRANRQRLITLLPHAVPALDAAFDATLAGLDGLDGGVRDWANVRCTAPDRLPIVGPLDSASLPGLWVCTALGARGLTLGLLCGELLAARLHGEPLPIDKKLAQMIGIERIDSTNFAEKSSTLNAEHSK